MAQGEEMRGPQPRPSEHYEYELDDYGLSRNADRLLQPPRRSFAAPIIVFSAGVMLGAIGFSVFAQLKPKPQSEAPIPPKQPDRHSERLVKPIEPFKSLVLDAAQSYLDLGRVRQPR
jgi:hypothetical protein